MSDCTLRTSSRCSLVAQLYVVPIEFDNLSWPMVLGHFPFLAIIRMSFAVKRLVPLSRTNYEGLDDSQILILHCLMYVPGVEV